MRGKNETDYGNQTVFLLFARVKNIVREIFVIDKASNLFRD